MESNKNHKSIRQRIVFINMFCIFASCLVIGIGSVILNYRITSKVLEISTQLSQNIEQEINLTKELYTSIGIIGILSIVTFFVLSGIVIKNTKNMGKHLELCSERLELLSKGDLTSELVTIERDDEIGLVAKTTNKIVDDFRTMINSLTYVLSEVSDGNLDIELDENLDNLFVNDFKPMLNSINKIIEQLNETLRYINVSGDEVAYGSSQVSRGAQILSQGTTEQASAIEELSQTIGEVLHKINETSKNAIEAKQLSMKSNQLTNIGKNNMNEMIVAMDDINNASNEISKIIKNIDDIAFQTNILALNAAVEAARAGEAGKGFAVVADEVRNLASKSAESAKDTAELIDKAILAVSNGNGIVLQMCKTLEEIIQGVQKSSNIIQYIANASEEQAQHISQINIGVEQISCVIQENSSIAQESAAASEELSSQAEVLKEKINQFNIKSELNEELIIA